MKEMLKTIILQMRKSKVTKRKVKLLHFTWTGKMVTPVHSDKLNIYNGILRVTTFKNICTKNTVKNSIDKWQKEYSADSIGPLK